MLYTTLDDIRMSSPFISERCVTPYEAFELIMISPLFTLEGVTPHDVFEDVRISPLLLHLLLVVAGSGLHFRYNKIMINDETDNVTNSSIVPAVEAEI